MSAKPLAGVLVADFSWAWAGPFCTLQLAHLGADVIRVESLARPCTLRRAPPFADFSPGPNRSGFFNQYNQGKRSVTLDLKHDGGVEVARRLIGRSDVVAESFGTGVMDRMGLGYEAARRLRPDVIMVSVSAYGRTGPERDFVSYGPAVSPLAGFSSVTGYAGGPPMGLGFSYGDPVAGLHGALAVLAALVHRRRTGEGQYIDVSLWESTTSLLPEALIEWEVTGVEPARMGNRVPGMAPHGVFRCAGENMWVSITVGSDTEWRALCGAIDAPDLAEDRRFATLTGRKANEDELEARITAWTLGRSPAEVTERLQGAGVAAFPSMSSRDLAEDPHLTQREFFVDVPHPEVGRRHHAGVPWRTTERPWAVEAPAPCLGQHNREVLVDLLGYTPTEADELRADGALG